MRFAVKQSTMNVGIVGLGAISPLHINALQRRGENIVALCDIDEARCRAAKEKFGLHAETYSSYTDMLDAESLDAVHICTPHYLHAEMVCAALSRGVNVLCEKPLAISEEQLISVEKAAMGSTARMGVCFQNRYGAAVNYLREFFKDKKITAAAAELVWRRGADYYASGNWRGKRETEGGGVMINQAIHSLDLLAWFCGMPYKVTAHISNNSLRGVVDVEDTAYGMFSLRQGGNFIISATNAAKFSFPVRLMFHSEEHTAEVVGDNVIVDGKYISKSDGLPLIGKEVWGTGHEKLINDFYSCIIGGRKFPIDFDEGSKSVRMVLAMYKSNGEEIDIK